MRRVTALFVGYWHIIVILLLFHVCQPVSAFFAYPEWGCEDGRTVGPCIQEDACKPVFRGRLVCTYNGEKVGDLLCNLVNAPIPVPSVAACETRIATISITFLNETTAEVSYTVPDPTVVPRVGNFVFVFSDLSAFVATPNVSCAIPLECFVDGLTIRANVPTTHATGVRNVFHINGILVGGSLDARVSIRAWHSDAPSWNLYSGSDVRLGRVRVAPYSPGGATAHLISSGNSRHIALSVHSSSGAPFVPALIRSVILAVGPLSIASNWTAPEHGDAPVSAIPTESIVIDYCSASWRDKDGHPWPIPAGLSSPGVWRYTPARGHEYQLASPAHVAGVVLLCRLGPPPLRLSFSGPAPTLESIANVMSAVPVAVWLRGVDGMLYAPEKPPVRLSTFAPVDNEPFVFAFTRRFPGAPSLPTKDMEKALFSPFWADAKGSQLSIAFQLNGDLRALGAVAVAEGLGSGFIEHLSSTYIPGLAKTLQEHEPYFGPYGVWACGTPEVPQECEYPNKCGETTSPLMCTVGGVPSPLGDGPCAWAPTPYSTEGCGSYMCRNKLGHFVPCTDEELCFPGCDTKPKPVTEEHHGNEPFDYTCVLHGKEVDASVFCPNKFVQPSFPQSCLSRSSCVDVCIDVNGDIMDCADPNSWEECNTIFDGSHLAFEAHRHGCIDSLLEEGDYVEVYPYSFCKGGAPDWESSWKLMPKRPCSPMICFVSTRRDFRWLCLIEDKVEKYTTCTPDRWRPCSNSCGVGTTTRKSSCGELNCFGWPAQYGAYDEYCIRALNSDFKPGTDRMCRDRSCPDNSWMCSIPGTDGERLVPCSPSFDCPTCSHGGDLTRTVDCMSSNGTIVDDDQCWDVRPPSSAFCPPASHGCTVDFTGSTCSASEAGVPAIGISSEGLKCLPFDGNPSAIYRVGQCLDEHGEPAERHLCDKGIIEQCDLPLCPDPPRWHCVPKGGGFLEAKDCLDDSVFRCPDTYCGCAITTRDLMCMQGGNQVSDALCTDVRPALSRRCPQLNSLCRASFERPVVCTADELGEDGSTTTRSYTDCVPPEASASVVFEAACTSPVGRGCRGCGDECDEASFRGQNASVLYVPREWCDGQMLVRDCPLPVCKSEYSFHWEVEEGSCISPGEYCETYAPNAVTCVAAKANETSFAVADSACDPSTRPPLFVSCAGSLTCVHGRCVTVLMPELDGAGNSTDVIGLGSCSCDAGFSGPECADSFEIESVSMISTEEDYASGQLRIGWNLTHPDTLRTAAITVNTSSLSISVALAPAATGSAALSVALLSTFLRPGPMALSVHIGGRSMSLTADLPPQCASFLHRPCGPNGTCNESTGVCKCGRGYTGEQCEKTVCEVKDCHPANSACIAVDGVADCRCTTLYGFRMFIDDRCTVPYRCAHMHMCKNNATVVGVIQGLDIACSGCVCLNNFVGVTCAECALDNRCGNGVPDSTCSRCMCDEGYAGDQCTCRYALITLLFARTSEASSLYELVKKKQVGLPLFNTWLAGLERTLQAATGEGPSGLSFKTDSYRHLNRDDDEEEEGKYFQITFRAYYPCPAAVTPVFHSLQFGAADPTTAAHAALRRLRASFLSTSLHSLPWLDGLDPLAGFGVKEPACDEELEICPRPVGSGGEPVVIIPPILPEPEPEVEEGRKGLTGLQMSIIILCCILVPVFIVIIGVGVKTFRESRDDLGAAPKVQPT